MTYNEDRRMRDFLCHKIHSRTAAGMPVEDLEARLQEILVRRKWKRRPDKNGWRQEAGHGE